MKAELHSACYGVERAEVGGHSAVYKTKNTKKSQKCI